MTDFIRTLIKRVFPKSLINSAKQFMTMERMDIFEKNSLTLLQETYKELAGNVGQKIAFSNHEFKVYSKHGGDGLILYIFSKIGVTNYSFVEMGVEQGKECNTANLSLNFGWRGMIIDANEEWMKIARSFYQEKLGKNASNVKAIACFITAENINKLLLDNGLHGEIDLLSIDIDGNDYWVWKAIDVVQPRVVVAEYNAAFGLEPRTMKYNPNFNYQKTYREDPLYFGASLSALAKLAKEKGYILAGCDLHGHDAFFIRKDVAEGKFNELSPSEAFYPNPHNLKTIGSIEKQFEQIKHLDFEYI